MTQGKDETIARTEAETIVGSGLHGLALFGLTMCNCNDGVLRLLDPSPARPRQGGKAESRSRPAA